MALLSGRSIAGVVQRWSQACSTLPAGIRLGRAVGTAQQKLSMATKAAADDAMEDIDWTEDMPVPIKRRVAALREVQSDYDKLIREFQRERAELQAKYEKQTAPLMSKRESIVAGAEKVGTYDIPDDADEKDEGIPDFWLTVITNHDMIGEYVTERDADVLSYLTDVRAVTLTGEDAGSFKLEFAFRENPYFKNKVLEKTLYMTNPDEVVPDKFVGCNIEWFPGKDTTVTVTKKKVSDKKGGKKGGVTINQVKPCESFFNFFKSPVVPENPKDMSEEELEKLQEQMDEDYEIAIAFRESLIPRAVEWYTGEAANPMYDDELDQYGEFEDEEEEPAYAPRRK